MRLPDFAGLMYTVRSLRRSPGYVAVSVLSIGVALGLATATFATVDAAMHPQLQLRDAERVFIADLRHANGHQKPSVAEQARVLSALPAISDVGVYQVNREYSNAGGHAAWRPVEHVTDNLFPVSGIHPRIGRFPTPAEAHAERAVVVSNGLWSDVFAGRDQIDAATINIEGHVYSIVGVMPIGYDYPLSADILVPFAAAGDVERVKHGEIVVKLRAGYDSISVKPQLAAVAAGLTARYVSPTSASSPYLLRLESVVPKHAKLSENLLELMLTAIAVGILLIGCTNVTALSLARALTRRRDHALRMALGAGRADIARAVFAEVALIAMPGALLGAAVAMWLTGMIRHITPADFARWGLFVPTLSPRVFGNSLLLLLIGMAVAGGLPAWRASRVAPADPLKDNAGTTTGRSRNEFRILVILELSAAMVLLMLTSLVSLSTRNLVGFKYDFDAERLYQVSPEWAPGSEDTTLVAMRAFERRISDRLRTVGGVTSVAVYSFGEPTGEMIVGDLVGHAPPLPARNYDVIGPGFFATTGIRLLKGRDIAASDELGLGAVVLSQAAAKRLFPRGDAIGHMVKLGALQSDRPWIPVVGIAADVPLGPSDDFDPDYMPPVYADVPGANHALRFVVRVTQAHGDLAVAIQRGLADVLPANGGANVAPWTYDQQMAIRLFQFFERLLSLLGLSALVLAATGLFSVLSYSVGQRMREFAVRQALGASRANIIRVVLVGAFEMALGGTAFGALLSFWASAGMSGLLFGVKNTDPVSLVIAELTLLTVTMLASLVPAVRAMRADPVEILRSS